MSRNSRTRTCTAWNAMRTVGGIAFVAAVLALGCTPNEPPPGQNEILIQNVAFNPASKTVTRGTTITWTNKDALTHTVTSGVPGQPDGLFDSGDLAQNQTFTHTFDSAGTFHYYCKHHASMTGTVVVQ